MSKRGPVEVTNKERGAPGVGEPHPDCVEPLLVREEPRPVEQSHLVQNREDDANKEGILEETQPDVVETLIEPEPEKQPHPDQQISAPVLRKHGRRQLQQRALSQW